VPIPRFLSLVAPPLCWGCGGPAAHDRPLCSACRSAVHWVEAEPVPVAGIPVWAPVAYEGPARALVGGLKFRGAAGLADQMAAAILARAPPALVDNSTLVPVPLHPARLRRRGFNQAERLSAAMAARSLLPVGRCLYRSGDRRAQVGRGRSDRQAAIRGSVTARAPAPDRALLVDDVITTGATLAECAAALRDAGSREIGAVAYARTLGR
jgi:ComF family protein